MRRIQLRATELGARLWRNNVGAYRHPESGWIRYGVQNPGGSDLIGITPVEITMEMVGKRVAIFTAIEVKKENEEATEDQQAFIDFIKLNGGITGVVKKEEDLDGLIQMSEMQKPIQGGAQSNS